MDNKLFYYNSIAMFDRLYHKDLLNIEHLEGGQKSWTVTDVTTEVENKFVGYVLSNDNYRYLFKHTTKSNVRKKLPIIASETRMVSYQGNVYHLIEDYSPARFKSEKRMSFRQFIDKLSALNHTNPHHQKLLLMLGIGQLLSRANFRVCSPAGAGKSSVPKSLKSLFGGITVIGMEPTVAKLEMRASSELLVLDETMNIPPAERRRIEQFLLSAADLSPTLEKHSRAYGNVGETINISQLSFSIFYNDITNYQDPKEYFDNIVGNTAILNRLPAFRVFGHFSEKWYEINNVDVKKLVEENWEQYTDLVYTFEYFKENFDSELSRYPHTIMHNLYPRLKQPDQDRARTSVGVLLNVFDAYSESESEFTEWCAILAACMQDYEDMLNYNSYLIEAKRKTSIAQFDALMENVDKAETFTKKKELLQAAGTIKEPSNTVW